MKRIWTYIIASICMIFTCNANAAVGWEENFDPLKSTWNEVTAYWTDLAGPTATLTEDDASNSYGVATSEVINVDVSVYSELVITSTAVESGGLYSIQIQEAVEGGAYANAVSYAGTPGTHVINLAALMGWSGTKSFVINIWIEGESKSVTFGQIQLREPAVSAGWSDHFDPINPNWAQATAAWTDEPGTTATLTENDPEKDYGCAGTEVITLDVSQFSELVVASTAMTGAYSIQIQEVGGSTPPKDAISFISEPSTHIINLAKLMGWSGIKSFKINIWIAGEGTSATFDLIQIRKPLPEQPAWTENFNPIKTTWMPVECHWTDAAGPNAVLTLVPPSQEINYGCTYSEIITLDVNDYNELYVKTSEVENGCLYSVQIQEVGGPGVHDAVSYIGTPSEHSINIQELMGWSGVKSFRLFIWLHNNGALNATFNKIELRPKSKAPRFFWHDDFDPLLTTWMEMPIEGEHAYWSDLLGSYAVLTEDNELDSYGKIESQALNADLDVYKELEFKIVDVEEGGRLDVGVQGQGGDWPYFNLVTYVTGPGTYKADIPAITGWSGLKLFRIVLWMNGNNKTATFDYIQLQKDCGTNLLAGDFSEDCKVDFQDLAEIAEAWMNTYDFLDLKDISDNWLVEE
ncbi:MAG: hypothetical protein ABFD79_09215 [Phycisphaerales bacterium]